MGSLFVAHVVRHIACTTVILSCPEDEVETFIKKQVTVSGSQLVAIAQVAIVSLQMCVKTGRAWLGRCC